MIKIKVLSDSITMSGHAEYDEYGKDIVCAAASSILTTTVNAILALENETITYENKDDTFSLRILKHTHTTDTLIKNMMHLLEDLENQYPENIRIK